MRHREVLQISRHRHELHRLGRLHFGLLGEAAGLVAVVDAQAVHSLVHDNRLAGVGDEKVANGDGDLVQWGERFAIERERREVAHAADQKLGAASDEVDLARLTLLVGDLAGLAESRGLEAVGSESAGVVAVDEQRLGQMGSERKGGFAARLGLVDGLERLRVTA